MKMTLLLKNLALVMLLASGSHVFAGEETLDLDTRFRAKIAKEKVKQGALERQSNAANGTTDGSSPDCGSQSIGNVNTGGRPGTAPREVFVFAPNAVNVVGAGGCR
jgi:hypothetical protein